MILSPCTRDAANAFVRLYHRHSRPVVGDLLRVALEDVRGGVVAVGIAGRPCRLLQDGRTVEVTRIAARETPNACTRLYGALCAAAASLGYWRAVTYTLETELGTSPKAAGFEDYGLTRDEDYDRPSRCRDPTPHRRAASAAGSATSRPTPGRTTRRRGRKNDDPHPTLSPARLRLRRHRLKAARARP